MCLLICNAVADQDQNFMQFFGIFGKNYMLAEILDPPLLSFDMDDKHDAQNLEL